MLVGLGTASTPAGEVLVAQIGDEICVYSAQFGVHTCGNTELIDEGKLFAVVPDCPTAVILGVLPDGVRSVQTESADSPEAREIPVSSNVYAGRIPLSDTVISGTIGSVPFEVSAPFGVMAQNCAG